jgi:hypothetical protein
VELPVDVHAVGGLQDRQARGAGAGEDDRVDARVGDQRAAGLVAAGQQRERVVRDARGVEGVGTYFIVLRSPGSWISARPRPSASAPAA